MPILIINDTSLDLLSRSLLNPDSIKTLTLESIQAERVKMSQFLSKALEPNFFGYNKDFTVRAPRMLFVLPTLIDLNLSMQLETSQLKVSMKVPCSVRAEIISINERDEIVVTLNQMHIDTEKFDQVLFDGNARTEEIIRRLHAHVDQLMNTNSSNSPLLWPCNSHVGQSDDVAVPQQATVLSSDKRLNFS